ncbi:MAG: hypothetical protein ACYTAQ_15720, partial [Planctomycetota bacterium]
MRLLVAAVALAATAPGVGIAQSTLDRPVTNPAVLSAPVFTETVTVEGAGWLRLYFGPPTTLEAGSFIRLTSVLDQEVQRLDSATLSEWSGTSAYFNGDAVVVQLVAGPGTTGNRVTLQHLALP